MGNEIMIICFPNHGRQNPAAEPGFGICFQQIMRHQQFVHGGGSLHEVSGHIGVKNGLRAVAGLEMPRVPQFMGQGEHICHAVVPGQQDKGILPVGTGAEAARGFPRVLGEVYPSVAVGCAYHLCIVISQNSQAFFNVGFGLLNGDFGVIFRVHGYLQISESHAVQSVYFLQQTGIPAHMGSQFFHNQVNLAVVHFPGDFLVKKQAVEHGAEPPQGGHCLFGLHLGIVGGSGDIFVFPYFFGKSGKCAAADRSIYFILVVILKEGVA